MVLTRAVASRLEKPILSKNERSMEGEVWVPGGLDEGLHDGVYQAPKIRVQCVIRHVLHLRTSCGEIIESGRYTHGEPPAHRSGLTRWPRL
jgi:hypothetical protein